MRPLAIAALAALMVGCAGGACRPGPPGSTCNCGTLAMGDAARTTLEVELIAYPDCPHARAMGESLHRALNSIGEGVGFREVNVEALAEDDPRRGWPAPTVLVNGEDLFGLTRPPPAPTTCRVYDGGVPGAEAMTARLQQRLCNGPCASRVSFSPRR